MNKFLVVTSDDCGMTHSVNTAIVEAIDDGVLTSTNLMVPCPWFEHAIVALKNKRVDLGIHLTLTCEWENYKWSPLTASNLLRNEYGVMHTNIKGLMQRADEATIKNECRAQIDKALKAGVEIKYVDLHMCLPLVSATSSNANEEFELELMSWVADIADEYRVMYPYRVDGSQLQYFNDSLEMSGKTHAEIEQFLKSLSPGYSHLSCHCGQDTPEQAHLTSEDDPAFPWCVRYRVADSAVLQSLWFGELLATNQIHLTGMPLEESKVNKYSEVSAWK